jgi:MazG C-terminal domain
VRKKSNAIELPTYERLVRATDRLPTDDLRPVLFGLFGEIGSIMAIAKKVRREKGAFVGYEDGILEEFGDAFWYFTALCRRHRLKLSDLLEEVIEMESRPRVVSATASRTSPVAIAHRFSSPNGAYPTLIKLGESMAGLLRLTSRTKGGRDAAKEFLLQFLNALQAVDLNFGDVLDFNIQKTVGRFLPPTRASLPTFDSKFDEEEQIPKHFEISITQRKSGKTYLRWNGVFVGHPLTDNILDRDGYRFHDVFHFSHAAILHWSPTFRALIKHKRKSNPLYDEAQDGGRAIVVEEGLTAWIFSRAKQADYFQKKTISFDLLKTIQEFVRGYEVQECPLSLWEEAILQGYGVFRKVCANEGGLVIGDRTKRKISYRAR